MSDNGDGTTQNTEIRNDGALVNALTGMGTGVDKSEHTRVGFATRLSHSTQEQLILQPIVQNICYAYPSEGTRAGWRITLGGKSDAQILSEFDNYRENIGGETEEEELVSDRELFKLGQAFANIYSGAALVINADDGKPPSEPLDTKRIRSIRSVEVLDCNKIVPDLTSTWNPLRPTHYNLIVIPNRGDRLHGMFEGSRNQNQNPKLHILHNGKTVYEYKIHRSRVIRFDGRDGRILPPDLLKFNSGWGQSSIDAIWNDFKQYESVYSSIASMLHDYSLFVYFLKGLKEQVEAGAEEALKARFRMLRMAASVLGGTALDAEGEKIEFVTRQFAGIPELGDRFRDRLVAVSGLPVTVILGRGPLGLAAQGTGDAEEQVWAKMVGQWQETVLRAKLRRLLRLIWLAQDGPTGGEEPEDWGIEFNPLLIQSDEEKMNVRAAAANTYLSYMREGVLLKEELRNSQFGGSEYSTEITLDQELWDRQQEQDQFGGFGSFGGGGEEVPPSTVEGEEMPPSTVEGEESQAMVQQDSQLVQQNLGNLDSDVTLNNSDARDGLRLPKFSNHTSDSRTDSTPIKRVVKWNGLDIGITHDVGDRRFTSAIPLDCCYGHVRRSWGQGADGKALDVYWGGNTSSDNAYKVRQLDIKSGMVDEDKYFLGFNSIESARDAYLRHAGRLRYGGIESVKPGELDQYRQDSSYHGDNCGCEACAVKAKKRNRRRSRSSKQAKSHDSGDRSDAEEPSKELNTDDWDDSDWIIYEHSKTGEKIVGKWLNQIHEWIKQRDSLKDVRDKLSELYEQLDGSGLESAIAQSNYLAQLSGQLSVIEEINGTNST